MFNEYLVNFLLRIFEIYSQLWKWLFYLTGPFNIIYYINGNNKKNITLNYYCNFLNTYTNGYYYCKIFNEDGTNHIMYNGNINKFETIKNNLLSQNQNKFIRKNIALLNNGKIINFDLNILDNYISNTEQYSKENIDIAHFLILQGINCTDIQIITIKPFLKKIIPINQIILSDIYK